MTSQREVFHEFRAQIEKLRARNENIYFKAGFLIALTWGVPLLLAAGEGNAWGLYEDKPFLFSISPWARFFVAVGVFVLMEPVAQRRFAAILRQLTHSGLLARGGERRAAEAGTRALTRRDGRPAKFICVAIAYFLALLSGLNLLDSTASSWLFERDGETTRVSLAAWWALFVSEPIFVFLLVRWIWRIIVWALLLNDLAKLELRLVASHPDGYGGIGFLATLPSVYTPFVFAVSCVLGGIVAETLIRDLLPTSSFAYLAIAWVIIVNALLTLPLIAFNEPLVRVKTETLKKAGAQETEYQRALERKILGSNLCVPRDDETLAVEQIPDPGPVFAGATKMATFLFSRKTLLPVSAAALIPLVAAAAIKIPYDELGTLLRRLLL